MPTVLIADFRLGLDVRKSPLTAPGGSLQILDNCYLTQGGEIEKRKSFVGMANWPQGATGCWGIFGQGGALHTFGTAGPRNENSSYFLGFGLDVTVDYHQLFPTDTTQTIAYIQDIEVYRGKFWVSFMSQQGNLLNFYDGVQMTTPPGTYGRVYQSKTYRTDAQYLRFSAVDDPTTDANTALSPGGGFIDVSANDADAESLIGLEIYYNELALFARLATQIWSVDPDPSLNALKQVIRIGCVAPNSIMQFGTGDVLFLADSGLRSLRALNTTLAAAVIDIGSPIDSLLQALNTSSGSPNGVNVTAQAVACVQPISGRYWLVIGFKVFVLSFFPASKISAWSTFTLPFQISRFAVVGNQVYAMDTNNSVWLYGGNDGMTYDDCLVTVRTPHDPLDKPNIMKKVSAVSAVLTGSWSIALGMAADNTELFELVANVVGTTTTQHRLPANGHGSHMALQLTCQADGPAVLSSVALDYATNEKL